MNHPSNLPRWVHYAIAVATTAASVYLRVLIGPILGSNMPVGFASLAVLVSAYIGGLWPGLLAALLNLIFSSLYSPSLFALQGNDPASRIQLATIVTIWTLMSVICGSLRTSEANLESAARENARVSLGLSSLLDSITDAYLAVDDELRLRRFNSMASELWGLTEDQLGQKLEEVLPSQMLDALRGPLGLAGSEPVNGAVEYFDKALDRWFDVKIFPHKRGDLVYFRDVTDRRSKELRLRESEQRFRLMADNAPMMIWLCDLTTRATWFNRPWLNYRRLTLTEALDDGWASSVNPRELARVQSEFARAFAKQESFQTGFQVAGVEEEERWLQVYGSPLDVPSKNQAFIIYCIDVTFQLLAEKRLRQSLESERVARTEAEKSNAVKDEFLATLSHELRTPLTTMLGWTELIKAKLLGTKEAGEGLKNIENSARQQLKLINDLLDMNRIAAGKMRLERTYVDLGELAESGVAMVRPAGKEKALTIQITVPAEDTVVFVDPDRTAQILGNILSNAIKFTPAGGSISVDVTHEQGWALVRVTDSGEGMDVTSLTSVFERFRQTDGSLTRRHGGLGLGLAIAKQLVELHGGAIKAESAGLDRGSTFTIAFPMHKLVLGRHESNPEPVIALPESPSLEGVTVLLVEDDHASRDLISRMLSLAGASVIEAASAEEARQELVNAHPDVLLSDIAMPMEDGYQLIKSIREIPSQNLRDIPAAAITAFAMAEDQKRALDAGYQLHLVKPIGSQKLIDSVIYLRSLR